MTPHAQTSSRQGPAPKPGLTSKQASASTPNQDGPADVAGLCLVATELTALLDRETKLLHAMRIRDIGPLQADKTRLTKACGTAIKTIDPAKPVPPAVKDRWRQISKRLGDAAIANEMALRVGHAATDKLVSAIIGHIEQRQKTATSYAKPMSRQMAPVRAAATNAGRRPTLAGVTLDRSL
jgi:hypothetical protein